MVGQTPIAIVGQACRFPGGAHSPAEFWRLLVEGRDAVTEIPPERWDRRHFFHPATDHHGTTYTCRAGTLGDVSGFDAAFFGISPREAEQMDPQQRLLLELAWEALESGGHPAERLAGGDCAVYVGISGTDYADIRLGDPNSGNAYFMLGSTLSIAANRISYVYDLHGPSMAIDTACSSAMVALHEAVAAVRSGRAPAALVGAVSLLLSPYPFIGFSKASMLAPYGRCRAFDKVARGYVRAEGGGMLLLKPLAAAERDGDTVLAVIRDVGINTDGRTHGIALPSPERQEELLRRIYAGIDPADLVYFEAHGTGTAVGDPVETMAIGRALGQQRAQPLPIGSVKTNLGHLEPASGMAGIMKAIAVLRHGMIPPSLHCEEPNPDIDFAGLNLEVARQAMPLPRTRRRRLVGVNSFGFGGANGHVVLEEHRRRRTAATPPPAGLRPPLVLSARAASALQELAGRLAESLEAGEAPAHYNLAWSAACRRTHHPHRLVLRSPDDVALRADLRAVAEGVMPDGATRGKAVGGRGRVAFLYSGNGAQWLGMGVQLLAEDAVFRAEVERIDAMVQARAGWSPIAELQAGAEASRLADTRFAQPMLFAIQAGITRSLAAQGLVPDGVAGHSVGEVAAAYAAGVLDLETAVHVILTRSTVQGRTHGLGRMAAVAIDAERAAALVAAAGGTLDLAAINAPAAVTLSGTEAALLALGETLAAEGVDFRLLDLQYAFHSRLLDPFRDELLAMLGSIAASPGERPLYSTVQGGRLDGTALEAGYWWDNVRQPVRFHDAVAAMLDDGFDLFVEIGPHPIMQSYVRQALRGSAVDAQVLATARRNAAGAERLRKAADEAYAAGARLDWTCHFPVPGTFFALPSYPWQRERHWFTPTPEARGELFFRWDGPLLGWRPTPGAPLWEAAIDAVCVPFLADHVVAGSPVFPAAGFVEMALEASRLLFGEDRHDIEQMEIRRPLVLDRTKVLRFAWNADTGTFQISSRTRLQDDPWSLHVTGRLAKATGAAPAALPDFATGAAPLRVEAAEHYAFAESIGLSYGPAFRTVQSVVVAGDTAEAVLDQAPLDGDYELHPALFDGCLQALFDVLAPHLPGGERRHAYLPAQIGRLLVHGDWRSVVGCRVRLEKLSLRSIVAAFTLFDADRRVVAEARSCRFQRMELSRAGQGTGVYAWQTVPLVPRVRGLAEPREIRAGTMPATAAPPLDLLARQFAAAALASPASVAPSPSTGEGRGGGDGAAHSVAPSPSTGEGRGGGDGAAESFAAILHRLAAEAPSGDAAAAWRAALAAYPAWLAELTMLGRVGRGLPGEATLEHYYDASPTMAPLHQALADAVAAFVAAWPAQHRLRVLEVGGRAPGLTRRLLALLPRDGFSYTVGVFDSDTAARVEGSLGPRPGLGVRVLDPAAPGQDGSYDLVISTAALSAWPTPAEALRHLAAAAPGGHVLAAETTPADWLDLLAAAGVPVASFAPETLAAAAGEAGLDPCSLCTLPGGALLSGTAPPATPAEPAADGALWLVLAGTKGAEGALAAALIERLDAAGLHALPLHPAGDEGSEDGLILDPACPESWHDVLQTLAEAESPPAGIVHLLGIGADMDVMAAQAARCRPPLALVQGLDRLARPERPRLVMVTTAALDLGALSVPGDAVAPVQAPLWGLGRVLRNEHPVLDCRLVDLHPGAAPLAEMAEALAAELLAAADDEDEVLLAADRRIGLRLRRVPAEAAPGGDAEVLSFAAGSLDNLAWTPAPRRAPGPGEIEIAVRATGLNFRDVMLAMGVLPDEAVENGFAGATVGMEAAGVVARVGPDVAGFAPGDAVVFFGPACFASHVTTRTIAVAPKPAALDFAAAATIPTTFFTAYYSLHHLARLQPGERVLIHGAAGGVGLAAIQYARHVGAEIFATAGTAEKRDLVQLAGVPADHVLDSRSLSFADEVLALTGGEGVDVVLNSLAGEAIHKSLATLRPFGRFVELGKRDFFANTPLGLRPFRNNIAYFGVDADQLMAVRPDLAGRLFAEMMALFVQGAFTPLPYRVFGRDRIVEAFRHMQQSRHVGKIIVAGAESLPEPAAAPAPRALTLDPDATYLVTGGLGGFGLATARWLADKGARHLVLASRRGQPAAADADAVLDALQAAGVAVHARACDVSDAAAVAALIAGLDGLPPLRGVVHAATVYEDGLSTAMTAEQLDRVLAPKLIGGWALHQATRGLPLDFFLVFSSVTAMLGNPGQANYVAANQYLESLVQARRAQGLPAQAVAWGAIADAGYLARNTELRDGLLKRTGVGALPVETAMRHLEALMTAGEPPVAIVAEMDWRVLGAAVPALRGPRFAEMVAGLRGEAAGEVLDLKKLLADLSPDEVRQALIELLAEQVGSVLRIPPDRLDHNTSVFDLGMDSLMALELRMAIEEKFGVELPAMALTEGASIARLAERMRDHLLGGARESASGLEAVMHQHAETIDTAAVQAEMEKLTSA